MAWQQQLHTIKDSITWDAVKDGWSSTWFQGSPGGQTAQPADYMGVLGKVEACRQTACVQPGAAHSAQRRAP